MSQEETDHLREKIRQAFKDGYLQALLEHCNYSRADIIAAYEFRFKEAPAIQELEDE